MRQNPHLLSRVIFCSSGNARGVGVRSSLGNSPSPIVAHCDESILLETEREHALARNRLHVAR